LQKFKPEASVSGTAFKTDYASYESDYKLEGNILTASRSLKTSKDRLPASAAHEYENFRDQVKKDEDFAIVVDITSSAASRVN